MACRGCGFCRCHQVLVDSLEALRVIAGVPIGVDCACRCPLPLPGQPPTPGHCGHNAKVGGVPDSEHELGMAADIKIQGMTPAQMYILALRIPAFAGGGIGVAVHGGYIHVDTRAGKARWCYGADGQQCAWDPALDA
jgi:hypothetical protein